MSQVQAKTAKTRRRLGDHQYRQHISNVLAEKTRKQKNETIIQEQYVDAYRGISVQAVNGESDLKTAIDLSGINADAETEEKKNWINEKLLLRQGVYLMRIGIYHVALKYFESAIEKKQDLLEARIYLSKCHLMMCNWPQALESVEGIFQVDPFNSRALYVKAEALYNKCHFERSLMYFHRGKRICPELEEFRLGIEKCRKTILDGTKPETAFKGSSARSLFEIFEKLSDVEMSNESRFKLDEKIIETPKIANLKLSSIVQKKKLKSVKLIGLALHSSPPDSGRCCQRPGLSSGDTAVKIAKVKQRCREKAKVALTDDRLLADKLYLENLARGITKAPEINLEKVQSAVSETAKQALEYLLDREEFWNQKNFGQKVSLLK